LIWYKWEKTIKEKFAKFIRIFVEITGNIIILLFKYDLISDLTFAYLGICLNDGNMLKYL